MLELSEVTEELFQDFLETVRFLVFGFQEVEWIGLSFKSKRELRGMICDAFNEIRLKVLKNSIQLVLKVEVDNLLRIVVGKSVVLVKKDSVKAQ